MRIIGKSRDYYDSAMAYGQDSESVFVRSPFDKADMIAANADAPAMYYGMEFVLKSGDWVPAYGYKHDQYLVNKSLRVRVETHNIIFCGRYYIGFVATFTENLQHKESIYFYTPEQEAKITEKYGVRFFASEFGAKPKTLFESYGHIYRNDFQKKVADWSIANRVVVALPYRNNLGHRYYKINCDGLSNFQFQKLIDPYQAHQEIAMFVSGVLPKDGPPMVEIQNVKDKLKKHGMDEWSFRKKVR